MPNDNSNAEQVGFFDETSGSYAPQDGQRLKTYQITPSPNKTTIVREFEWEAAQGKWKKIGQTIEQGS
jgi:hypothetical protein